MGKSTTTTLCPACEVQSEDCACGLTPIVMLHEEAILACTTEIFIQEVEHPGVPDEKMFAFSIVHTDRKVVEQYQGNKRMTTLQAHDDEVWDSIVNRVQSLSCGRIGDGQPETTEVAQKDEPL